MVTDLYEDLGLDKSATTEEIVSAGRQAMKRAHPDAGGDVEDFHRVSRAVAVLRDPTARQRYDETGETSRGPDASPEALAMQMLGSLLGTILQDESVDPVTQDIVQLMHRMIDNAIVQLQQQIVAWDKRIARTEQFKKRLKRKAKKKGVPDTLAGMLDANIREAKLGKSKAENLIESQKLAKEMAQAYVYEADAPPPDPYEVLRRAAMGHPAPGYSPFFK